MKQIIDNFSTDSSGYAAFRPESPAEIFDFLYNNVPAFDAAWDCGTGNGQAAHKLAERFKHVYGTDISSQQIELAEKKDNIIYLVERAEKTSIPDHCIHLVTIAQAIHWFDFDAFYKEVNRVANPGALIAAWTYNLLRLTPQVNEVIDHLYFDIIRPYWDKERAYVDAEYKTIPFPFEEIPTPLFTISRRWNLQQLLGYISTWSGIKHFIAKTQTDPVMLISNDLQKVWGDDEFLEVSWPVFMRAGRVN